MVQKITQHFPLFITFYGAIKMVVPIKSDISAVTTQSAHRHWFVIIFVVVSDIYIMYFELD